MLDEDKFRQLLQKLLRKSKANKINWIEEEAPIGEAYLVSFPNNSQIRVYYKSPPSAPDFARATLMINERLAIAIDTEESKDSDWELLKSLYTEARRCVFGFDEALDAIEKALSSDAPTGVSPDEEYVLPPSPPPDEIPF